MAASTGSAGVGASLVLPAAGTAPSQARAFVVAQLREWNLSRCEDAVTLLVSELVTNALLHARTDMLLRLGRHEGAVLLEVSDGSPQQPTPRRFSLHAGTGRGLNLVATLSQDWGVRSSAGGKTVWALLSTDPPDERAGYFDIDSVEAL